MAFGCSAGSSRRLITSNQAAPKSTSTTCEVASFSLSSETETKKLKVPEIVASQKDATFVLHILLHRSTTHPLSWCFQERQQQQTQFPCGRLKAFNFRGCTAGRRAARDFMWKKLNNDANGFQIDSRSEVWLRLFPRLCDSSRQAQGSEGRSRSSYQLGGDCAVGRLS